MKTSWPTKSLEEISEVFTDGDWIEKKDQSSSGIRLVQTGNIGIGVYKDRSSHARYISQQTYKTLSCTEVRPGDCLVSRLPDPVGRCCIIPETTQRMVTAVDCTIIRFQKKVILTEWFVNFSLSQEYQHQIDTKVGGATRQRISRKNLSKIQIPLPPLFEQLRIVKNLTEVFDYISRVKERNEKNLRNVKDFFESFLQNIFKNPQVNWKTKSLNEVCNFQNGFAFKSSLFSENGLPILRISNIQHDKISYSRLVYFHKSSYNIDFERYKVKKGDLVIAMSGATTGKLALSNTDETFYLNQRVGKFEPHDCLLKEFLFYFLKTRIKENLKISLGSAQPNLSTEQVNNFKLCLPPMAEQKAIVAQLDTLSAETQKLEAIYKRKLIALDELKKSVLKKAFAGEL